LKSKKKQYCTKFYDTYCKENSDCLTNNCNTDNQCMDSKDFYIYDCSNLDSGLKENNNSENEVKEIEGYYGCKKIDNEYCDDSSECVNNFSLDGYCFGEGYYDVIHRYDKSNRITYFMIIAFIIIVIIIIILSRYLLKNVIKKKRKKVFKKYNK